MYKGVLLLRGREHDDRIRKERSMIYDLQKASMWKRISAFLFDVILLGIVAVMFAWSLSAALGYDRQSQALDAAYDRYAEEYGVNFSMSLAEYEAMTEEEAANLQAAYDALSADEEAVYAYGMMIQLTLLITSLCLLLAHLTMEFAIPLALGNGQTLGKKIFGLGVMRTDGVKVGGVVMFIRAILGKYTIETMIPVLIAVMIFFNMIGIVGPLVLALILILQIVLLAVTQTNSAIHDLLAKTVVVDYMSQRIFENEEELIEFKKKLHAERSARSEY